MTMIYGLVTAHAALVLQQAKGTTQKASALSTWGMWIMIGVMIVVFYLLLIRPQRKRSQEHDQMVSELRKGDEVVTIGGIIGTIKKQTEDTVTLEVDEGTILTFTRSAIARRLTEPEPEEEEEAEEPAAEAEEETEEEKPEEEEGSGGEEK